MVASQAAPSALGVPETIRFIDTIIGFVAVLVLGGLSLVAGVFAAALLSISTGVILLLLVGAWAPRRAPAYALRMISLARARPTITVFSLGATVLMAVPLAVQHRPFWERRSSCAAAKSDAQRFISTGRIDFARSAYLTALADCDDARSVNEIRVRIEAAEKTVEDRAAQAAAARRDAAASERKAAAERLRRASPAERADAIRQCLLGSGCSPADADAIADAGATEREQVSLRRLGHAWGAHATALRGKDGTELTNWAIAAAARSLQGCGTSDILKIPSTALGEAAKDIRVERGKSIRVSGSVAQIRRDGAATVGTMLAQSGWVYFVVVGASRGIVDDSFAELVGIVVQRYVFANALGGETDSIVVVGRFTGQADSDPPLPREAPIHRQEPNAPAVAAKATTTPSTSAAPGAPAPVPDPTATEAAPAAPMPEAPF